jgi:hypothetical protein
LDPAAPANRSAKSRQSIRILRERLGQDLDRDLAL